MTDVNDIEMVPNTDTKGAPYRDEQGYFYLAQGREDHDYAPEVSWQGVHKFWTSICRVEIGPAVLVTREELKDWGALAPLMVWLDNSFRVSDRKSNFWTEFLGGLTIFFTIAYVLVTNPFILRGTGIPTNGVFFSTVLSAGVLTNVMGIVTNMPIVVGPSLALNFYFREVAVACPNNPTNELANSACASWGESSLPWSDALGAVYISGWLYLAATVTGFRGYLYSAVPRSIRSAIAVGTGFFLCYYGLKIGGVTRIQIQENYVDNFLSEVECNGGLCNDIDLSQRWYNHGIADFTVHPAARIAVLGIAFLSALELFKVKGSYILAIWFCTLIGISYYQCRSTRNYGDEAQDPCVTDLHLWGGPPNQIPFLVNWSHNPAGRLTFKYANTNFFWRVVWTFLYFELFDSYGALEGIVSRLGLTNNFPTVSMDRVNRAMFVDGFSVWLGSIMGANNMTVYIESTAGVEAGARTGLAAVVCGCCLLLCLFFLNPLVSIIPPCATTCVLVMVGVNSMLEYKRINFQDYILRLTSFFIIATMGFTFSITNGISVGFIFYCGLQIFAVVLKKVGIDVEVIRPGTKVEFPHPFLILMAIFASCRFSYLSW